MARAKKNVDAPLGLHNGLPILAKKIKVTKTGDGLSQAMTIIPVDVKDGSEHYVSMRLRHTRTYHDNVFSQDDPDLLVGYEEVLQFRAEGAVFDDRADAAEQVFEMEARIAAKAAKEAARLEREKKKERGEFPLPDMPEDEDDNSEPF